ncbi:galactose-specific lectin nattectin-like [Labrus mixtus]|uniref:galactose-specific lectin nattectin-like n=1 Tax=Labrus mixtus TaxID=508554 RepID=UPI0029C0D5EF|nr:galactose-specific lectin nattectin-like [Labrus mixtus]
MESAFRLFVLLGLSCGLWMGADAKCDKKGDCCMVCPEGWLELNSRCFKFIFNEKDWDDAEDSCIEQGGNLASIHSDEDYNALRNLVKTSTGIDKQTWVGGYDAVKEACWRWSDGSSFNFDNWGPKEPNNFGKGEHCLELNFNKKDWGNDWYCSYKRSYICGRDKVKANQD